MYPVTGPCCDIDAKAIRVIHILEHRYTRHGFRLNVKPIKTSLMASCFGLAQTEARQLASNRRTLTCQSYHEAITIQFVDTYKRF